MAKSKKEKEVKQEKSNPNHKEDFFKVLGLVAVPPKKSGSK